MGCTNSKAEDETTVEHCRSRCRLINEAVYYRYIMADAQADYAVSLRSLAFSLPAFFLPTISPDTPVLSNRNMPSGRSIQFDSARTSESSHVRHSDVVINYSKHHPQPTIVSSKHHPQPPSVSMEQHQKSPEKPPPMQNYQFGPYQDPHPAAQNSKFSSDHYPPVNYRMPPMASFFNFSMPSTSSNKASEASPAQRKEPITPPTMGPSSSSSDSSPWDFLNPFGSYDSYYYNYTPNTSFRKVREEEGIPELEEVKDESEHAASAQTSKRIEKMKEEEDADTNSKSVSARGSSVGDKSVRFSFRRELHSRDMGREVEEESVAPTRIFRDDLEIISEIKRQFERAADGAKAVAELLEAGKRPYHFKDSIRKVAGRLCCGLPSISNSIDDESNYEGFNSTRNNSSLSITLQKLYMWETKLLVEVQNEESLRADYEKKCSEFNSSDHRGLDPEKLEEIRSNITKLSTRIRITLQVLRSISNKISEIRDQELWPQICELVQELMKMWEIMLECHQAQLHAISQAKTLGSIFLSGTNSQLQMESTKQLQLDLLSWRTSLLTWIYAQKNYVQSLNSWLMTGLNYEPEITEDGPAPFSPGRLGLSPVFIILNDWFEMIEKISEHNVVEEAMSPLYDRVVQLREKQKLETHQILTADKDLKAIRNMERDEKLLRKELKAKKRKLKSLLGQHNVNSGRIGMNSGSAPDTDSLKLNLGRVFEFMEGFASANARAYEELHMHSEED